MRLEAALQLSSIQKSCLIVWEGGRVTSSQRLWYRTERSGVSVTSLRAMVGGRVVFNTRANLLSFAILEQRRLCACNFERPPTPPSSVNKCRCAVAWCDWKRRFNSAAFKKVVSSSGRVGGSLHRKGCGIEQSAAV